MSARRGPERLPTRGVGTRLMLAQALVVLTALATAAVVGSLIGTPLFHEHLLQAGHVPNSPELDHVEMAYRSATTVSLLVAGAIALLASLAVTWFVTRRITRPLDELAGVAGRLSRGDYAARATPMNAGPEFDALTSALNDAAGRLQTTEETRHRLLGDLAHELRTPVATISAYVDALDDGLVGWDGDASRVLRSNTERLGRLGDDLALVSRAEEGRLEISPRLVELGEIAQTVVAAQGPRFEAAGVGLTCRREAAVMVEADPQRIEQVLTNLLNNALRHTPAGGAVSVRVSCPTGDRPVASVVVADDGEGIAAPVLPHVFERFYRGDAARARDRAGSGIGLTISRSLARAHGGDLVARSDGTGHGAEFELTLPRAR